MLQTTSVPAHRVKNKEGERAVKARNQRAIINVVTHLHQNERSGSSPLAECLFHISQEEGLDLLLSLGPKNPTKGPPWPDSLPVKQP